MIKKKFLFIVFIMIFGLLQASQEIVSKRKGLFLIALEEAQNQNANFIACSCSDDTQAIKEKSKQAIIDLRKSNNTLRLIDYILDDKRMSNAENGKNWVEEPASVDSIIQHSFYQTPFTRGRVVYVIGSDDHKSLEQHRVDINNLCRTWQVAVFVHTTKMNTDLKEFFKNRGAIIIDEESNISYMSRLLVFASVVGLLGYLGYKFFVSKN